MNLSPTQAQTFFLGRKSSARLASVALPAAAVTTALFFAMQNLVAVEDFSPPAMTVYDIEPYVEQKTPQPNDPIDRRPPARPEVVAPPPSPPKLANSIVTPDGPVGMYVGATPASYGEVDLTGLRPTGIGAIIDRTIQPITPPVPTYPSAAIRTGKEGYCEVHLTVSPQGDPFNVRAECSDPVFARSAQRAIEKVKFAPQIRNGRPVTVTGVVYPLEFRLKQ